MVPDAMKMDNESFERTKNDEDITAMLVEGLAADDVADRVLWNSLLRVDWSRPSLDHTRSKAIDLALAKILASKEGHGQARIEDAGWAIQLMGVMPENALGDRIYSTAVPQRNTERLLQAMVRVLDHPSSYLETAEHPASKACILVVTLLVRLIKHKTKMCETRQAKEHIARAALKVWVWGGISHRERTWRKLPWATIGRYGLIALHLVMQDNKTWTYFKRICDTKGETGWKRAIAWLKGRAEMLEAEPIKDSGDIAGLIRAVVTFSEMSGRAASMIFESSIPNVCIKLLKNGGPIDGEYLTAAADLVHSVVHGLDRLDTLAFTNVTMDHLRAGILGLVRDVVLYTVPDPDHPSYAKTWTYLRFILSSLLHPQAVPVIANAFSSLPSLIDEDMASDQKETWDRLIHTVNIFEMAYAHFSEKCRGLCNNLKCSEPISTTSICGGCKQVAYCSKTCQVESWTDGHRTDCNAYRTGFMKEARTSIKSRCYLAHVIAALFGDSNSHPKWKKEQSQDHVLAPEPEFRVFNVGPGISKNDMFSVQKLIDLGSTCRLSSELRGMLEIAKADKQTVLAALAVADPPNERFYIFSLLKERAGATGLKMVPVKVTEAAELDCFIKNYA